MKHAKIEHGVAVSVILSDAPFAGHDVPVPEGLPVTVGTGYDGASFDVTPPGPPEPTPRALTRVEFVRLCMSAGGMTPEMLVQAKADPALAAMWIMLEMATEVSRDDPEIEPGLTALAQLGYLPDGAQAVLDAWPAA